METYIECYVAECNYFFMNTFKMLVEATRLRESFIASRTLNIRVAHFLVFEFPAGKQEK